MKILITLALFISSHSFAATKIYETICKKQDCFKYGWITTSDAGYEMNTVCKNRDCTKFGWHSEANDQSRYDVVCRAGGCFEDGWHSVQSVGGDNLYDDVFCKFGSCLTYGWTVRTGYDLMGGDVTCNKNNCSKFGGRSFWRGRPSETICYRGDCYKYGWTLNIY